MTFPPELRSAADARHHAEQVLRDWELAPLADATRLLVSELVINAVLHAGTEAELVLRRNDGHLRVEVSDHSTQVPVRQAYSPSSPTGRGLLILDDLADEWGVDVGDDGKTVWFALQVPGRRDGETDDGDGARAEGAAP